MNIRFFQKFRVTMLNAMRFVPCRFTQPVRLTALILIATCAWPVAAQSISDRLSADNNHAIFVNALKKSGLLEILKTGNPVTLFAPTDSAMRLEGSSFLLETVLLTKTNENRLHELLSQHIVPGTHPAFEHIAHSLKLATLAGTCLSVDRMGSAIKVGPESVVTGRVSADNGTIYFVDRLLWRPFEDSQQCWRNSITGSPENMDKSQTASEIQPSAGILGHSR